MTNTLLNILEILSQLSSNGFRNRTCLCLLSVISIPLKGRMSWKEGADLPQISVLPRARIQMDPM